MSSKRKAGPAKGRANKRGRKKESDIESDLSDSSEAENSTQATDEVLIAGHGDVMDEPTKLPEELLKTLIKPAGQLLIFGMVSWEMVGRRENKSGQRIVPNIYTPQKFTNLKVRLVDFGVSVCWEMNLLFVLKLAQ